MIYRLVTNVYPKIAGDLAVDSAVEAVASQFSSWLPFKGAFIRWMLGKSIAEIPNYINKALASIRLNVEKLLDAMLGESDYTKFNEGEHVSEIAVTFYSDKPVDFVVTYLNAWVDLPFVSETSEAREIRLQIANLEKLADANEAQINAILDQIEWKTHDMHLYIEEVAA